MLKTAEAQSDQSLMIGRINKSNKDDNTQIPQKTHDCLIFCLCVVYLRDAQCFKNATSSVVEESCNNGSRDIKSASLERQCRCQHPAFLLLY